MLLSVLSALARLDLDPWREAAELARMPQQTATQRLTSLIEALPNQPLTRPEPETVSTRLIALLPPAASPSVASSNKVSGGVPTLNSRAIFCVILVNLIVMFGAEWTASREWKNSGQAARGRLAPVLNRPSRTAARTVATRCAP
jgi:hypothetical protein